MTTEQRFSLVKPSLNTPFHIDFDWWKNNDSDWRVFLYDFLCDFHREAFKDQPSDIVIDAVDPATAEVHQEDGLLYTLMTHCARQPEFIQPGASLVTMIFRIFLSNGNKPLSSEELSQLANRPANTILVTLTGRQIYKGIRPFHRKEPL